MNAVAAVFGASDAHGTRALVKTMLDRMAARGAGHRVVVAEGAAVLAAAGRSPVFGNKPERAMLAGDLRLANRPELLAELGLAAEVADGAIALEAYCRWGVEVGRHLAGPFAIVVLDRSDSRLIAMPDALGIRPLYYRPGAVHLRVASELQALVEDGDVPDEGFLAEALAGATIDREGTPYASIRRIPAAHALIADASGIRVQRYWEPSREPMPGAPEDVGARFRAVFDETVDACCEGQRAVGVHLDGSSHASAVLAAVTAREDTDPVPVSVPVHDTASDDAAQTGPPATDLDSIRHWLDLPDLPTGRPLLRRMCEPLKEQGVTVLLSARGGDLWPGTEPAGPRGWTGSMVQVPQRVRRLFKSFVPPRVPDWIDSRFANRVDLADRLARQPSVDSGPSGSWDDLRSHLESGEEALAKDRADRLSVESGVEWRHPFYDRRVVELAFASASAGIAAAGHGSAARTPVDPAGRVLVDALRRADVRPLLHFRRLTALGWIRKGPLTLLREQAMAGRHDTALALWRVLGVEAWLEQVLGQTPQDTSAR